MQFQEKLKMLRQKKGLSQAALAKNIYVSRSAIAKWESGLGTPSASNLQALCTFFGVEEEWLMSRNDLKQQVDLTHARTKILILALLAIAVPVTGLLLGHCITFTARRSVSLYYPPLSLFGYIAPIIARSMDFYVFPPFLGRHDRVFRSHDRNQNIADTYAPLPVGKCGGTCRLHDHLFDHLFPCRIGGRSRLYDMLVVRMN